MRYYVQSTVESTVVSKIHSNNKKITKSFTGCIDTTFNKYMGLGQSRVTHTQGGAGGSNPRYHKMNQMEQNLDHENRDRGVEIDSIEDPADNDNNDEQENEPENNPEENKDQEECVTNDE